MGQPTVAQRVEAIEETFDLTEGKMTNFGEEMKELIKKGVDEAFEKAMDAMRQSLAEWFKESQIKAAKTMGLQLFPVPNEDKGEENDKGEESTHSKETSSDVSKLLPEMAASQVFDENSEIVFVQKSPMSISQGTNPIICSPNSYWNDLRTHCNRVMVYKLHENEYGKIDSNFYDKFKNMIKSRKLTYTKVECSNNTIELRTVDGLMKDKSQGAPNGYYIIPVDARLLQGDPLKIDQSPRTGESLVVTKNPGDGVYSSSTCKQGEIRVVVIAIGAHNFFGRATHLVENTTHVGHLQQVLSAIGNFGICSIAIGKLIDDVPCQIEEGLYLGSIGAANNKSALRSLNITHILTMASLMPPYPDEFKYKIVDVQDRHDVSISRYFDDCFAFIDEAKEMGGKVLVHCYAGISRSVTVIVAYLIKKRGLSCSEALEHVKSKRPIASPNPGFILQLQNFERSLRGPSTESSSTFKQ